jgi:hypothetical protein
VFILLFSDHSQDAPAASVTNETGNNGGFSITVVIGNPISACYTKFLQMFRSIFRTVGTNFFPLSSPSNFFKSSRRLNLNPFMKAQAMAKSESFPCKICVSERVQVLFLMTM